MANGAPPAVCAAVERAVGGRCTFSLLAGGSNRRTTQRARRARWVVRAAPAPAESLERSLAAQALARSVGVRAPLTLDAGLAHGEGGAYRWCVETFAPGAPFSHRLTGAPGARPAIDDLAAQLRRLHSCAVDAFGDLPPRPYPVYPSAAAWAANKLRRVAAAVALAGGDESLFPQIAEVYAVAGSTYGGGARLCKGDCASGNLLVDNGGVTIIDWEWAQGLDPAADIAYWCHFTPAAAARERLLLAYAPDEPAAFALRVRAYRVIHAIELIHVFAERPGTRAVAALRAQWRAIERLLPGALG